MVAVMRGETMSETGPKTDGSFLGLDRVHGELDEIFLRHQEAMIAVRLSEANELLDRFEERLRVHMRHEEDLLLPIYEARRDRENPMKGVGADVYILEHKKMLELLAKIRDCLRDLVAPGNPAPRDVIDLLDRECTFKHLVEHHNMREHNVLYAELDRITSMEERRTLMERCSKKWAAGSGPHI